VEPPATGPTAGLSACSDTEKPLPEALVAPFRQTPQQRERSRLALRRNLWYRHAWLLQHRLLELLSESELLELQLSPLKRIVN
jgi:hypothetical protein